MSLPLLLPNAWNNLQLHSYRVWAGLLTLKAWSPVPQPQQLQGLDSATVSSPQPQQLGLQAPWLAGLPHRGPLSSTCGSHECESEEPALTQMGPQPSDYVGHIGGEESVSRAPGVPAWGVSAHGRGLSRLTSLKQSHRHFPWKMTLCHLAQTYAKVLLWNHGESPHLEPDCSLLPTAQTNPWQNQGWYPLSNSRAKWGALFIILVWLAFKILGFLIENNQENSQNSKSSRFTKTAIYCTTI